MSIPDVCRGFNMLNLYNANNTGTEIGLGKAIPIGIEELQRDRALCGDGIGHPQGAPLQFLGAGFFCFTCVL